MRAAALAVVLLAAAIAAPAWCAPLVVTYRPPSDPRDSRPAYFIGLLRLALEETRDSDGPFQLQPAPMALPQARALALLAENRTVNVVWSMTSRKREKELRAIRIPLLKGLLGYRLLVTRRDDVSRLLSVNSVDDLKAFTAVQGHDWPDTSILRANGLPVTGVDNYESLFRMVAARRVDYLPRSVVEFSEELKARPDMPLAIVPSVMLHYVAPIYFFVNTHDNTLARRIGTGLRKAIRDGRFDRYFCNAPDVAAFRHLLAKGDFRHIIELSNPLLPADAPVQQASLWTDPQRLPNTCGS
jgi:hypothetical protein